jgi:hypothetical protein
MENNLISPEVTLLIRGKINTELLNKYLLNYYHNYIIISTWPDSPWVNSINLKLVNYNKHSVILNMQKPSDSFEGFQNLFYQIKCVYTALDSISTKYTIILRGDEYFSNLDYVFDSIKYATNYIFCSPIFFRPKSFHPFHISDHLLAGTTQNLKMMFDTSYKNFSKNDLPLVYEPEVYLTKNYLFRKYGRRMSVFDKKIISPEVSMKNHFRILDLNKMKPYTAVFNQIGAVWNSNFIPEENNSISKIEDY